MPQLLQYSTYTVLQYNFYKIGLKLWIIYQEILQTVQKENVDGSPGCLTYSIHQ